MVRTLLHFIFYNQYLIFPETDKEKPCLSAGLDYSFQFLSESSYIFR
jgi:hypothetical protein